MTKVFVNGCWVGVHRDPDDLVKTMQQLRRSVSMMVSSEVSIFRDIKARRAWVGRRRACYTALLLHGNVLGSGIFFLAVVAR